jgi:hypothetical protein
MAPLLRVPTISRSARWWWRVFKLFPRSVVLARSSPLEATLESGRLGLSLRGESYSRFVEDFRVNMTMCTARLGERGEKHSEGG